MICPTHKIQPLIRCEPRNRRLASRDAALRLASGDALAGLALLVWVSVGSAARSAFENAPAVELRRDAKHGKDKLGKIRYRIATTGSAIERRPAPARCMSRGITKSNAARGAALGAMSDKVDSGKIAEIATELA
jgi:hypothetical protein